MLRHIKIRWIELTTLGFVCTFASILQVFFSPLEVMLMSFSVGSLLYMGLVVIVFLPLDHDALSKRVTRFDCGHLTVMALGWAAIIGVFIAICGFIGLEGQSNFEITISISAITIAWVLLHFIGAIHYTHTQYGGEGPDKCDLTFPGKTPGLFIDMLYFSFTVGMTFATSDVEVNTSQMRFLVLVHAVASFLFNLFIFAIAVAAISRMLGI
jgi:uncharacterized membrane protein